MADVIFHPDASTDFAQALTWYAKHSRRAARGFETEIERITGTLAVHPLRYPECEAGCREATLRRYPYDLVYRVETNGTILIVAVAHSSREPGYWLDRIQ